MRNLPQTKEVKLKEGVFIGPQIRELIKDEYFDTLLQGDGKTDWDTFIFVVKGFLGNRRAQNYEELVNNLLQSYQNLGCNISEKIHFLHLHLDFSPKNCGAVSDEHGERFDKHIPSMEKRYQAKWNCAMLADYCWTLVRDAPTMECKRQAKRKKKWFCLCYIMNLHEKRLCRCSIYVVNIISKQNKSTKHIVFQ